MECNIDHWIDPERPGYLRRDAILSGKEMREAIRLELKRWDGASMELVHTSPDPLRAKVLRLQAPEELRKAVADAEAKLEEAQSLSIDAFDRWKAAIDDGRKFANATYGVGELSAKAIAQKKKIDAAIEDAQKDFRACEDAETEARVQATRARAAVDRWVYDERLRREEAKQAEAATAKKPESLGERISRLKAKIAG